MKTMLITGGGGFIGRNLINRLVALASYRIICLDQRLIDFYPQEVECVQGTFSDKDLLRKLLPGVDVVVHLGSNALPVNSDYVTDVEQNLLGSISLIKECENAKVGKIVFASSGGTIYGPDVKVPTSEESACNPICSYGIIKVAIENYLKLASRLTGMKSITLRIANPYGPWQNWNAVQGAIAVFCHKILSDLPITLFGDGCVERDFVYIDDLIDAFMKAIECDCVSESVNIGSGHCVSLIDILNAISKISGKSFKLDRLPARGCDVPRSCLAVGRAANILGWKPITSLAEGVRKTLEWQASHPTAF